MEQKLKLPYISSVANINLYYSKRLEEDYEMNHFKKQEARLAKLLDQAAECGNEGSPSAPPDEFNKIII